MTNCKETDTGSFRIRKDSVLAWMQCFYPVFVRSGQEKTFWISEREMASFRSFCRPKRKIEIQEDSADMARRSVEMNGLSDRIEILNADIRNGSDLFKPGSFHVVVSNPPYMIGTHGLKCEQEPMTIARHEVCCTLDDVIREGSRVLKDKGRFYMIHRPFRLVEIFETFRTYHLEPKRMRMIHPYVNKEPNMVMIEAVKGGRARLHVEKPLIVFESKGKYTREIADLYGF